MSSAAKEPSNVPGYATVLDIFGTAYSIICFFLLGTLLYYREEDAKSFTNPYDYVPLFFLIANETFLLLVQLLKWTWATFALLLTHLTSIGFFFAMCLMDEIPEYHFSVCLTLIGIGFFVCFLSIVSFMDIRRTFGSPQVSTISKYRMTALAAFANFIPLALCVSPRGESVQSIFSTFTGIAVGVMGIVAGFLFRVQSVTIIRYTAFSCSVITYLIYLLSYFFKPDRFDISVFTIIAAPFATLAAIAGRMLAITVTPPSQQAPVTSLTVAGQYAALMYLTAPNELVDGIISQPVFLGMIIGSSLLVLIIDIVYGHLSGDAASSQQEPKSGEGYVSLLDQADSDEEATAPSAPIPAAKAPLATRLGNENTLRFLALVLLFACAFGLADESDHVGSVGMGPLAAIAVVYLLPFGTRNCFIILFIASTIFISLDAGLRKLLDNTVFYTLFTASSIGTEAIVLSHIRAYGPKTSSIIVGVYIAIRYGLRPLIFDSHTSLYVRIASAVANLLCCPLAYWCDRGWKKASVFGRAIAV